MPLQRMRFLPRSGNTVNVSPIVARFVGRAVGSVEVDCGARKNSIVVVDKYIIPILRSADVINVVEFCAIMKCHITDTG